MKIRDVMTPDIEVVTPGDMLSTAARLMADLGFEAIPVADDNKLIGMITAHDMAVRIAANGSDPEATVVRQAMTTDLLYCFENESTDDVARKMAEWWVRRLPVVNPEKRLIGMVSLADLPALNAPLHNPKQTAQCDPFRAPYSGGALPPASLEGGLPGVSKLVRDRR